MHTPYTSGVMREVKEEEEEKEERRRKKKNKIEISSSIFSTVKRSNGTASLTSLFRVYLGAAPIP